MWLAFQRTPKWYQWKIRTKVGNNEMFQPSFFMTRYILITACHILCVCCIPPIFEVIHTISTPNLRMNNKIEWLKYWYCMELWTLGHMKKFLSIYKYLSRLFTRIFWYMIIGCILILRWIKINRWRFVKRVDANKINVPWAIYTNIHFSFTIV